MTPHASDAKSFWYYNVRQWLHQAAEKVVQEVGSMDVLAKTVCQEQPTVVWNLHQHDRGDFSSPLAFVLAKHLKMAPQTLAEGIAQHLQTVETVARAWGDKGHVNIALHSWCWHDSLKKALARGKSYGCSTYGEGKKINVEYVSANPTGPLHIAHVRGAVLGDALANLLQAVGYDVTREYFVNDAGNQVKILAQTVLLHLEALENNTEAHIPSGYYPGPHGRAIAEAIRQKAQKDGRPWQQWSLEEVGDFATHWVMETIKRDLHALGIQHHLFTSEKTLHQQGLCAHMVQRLQAVGAVYRGALPDPVAYMQPEAQKQSTEQDHAVAHGEPYVHTLPQVRARPEISSLGGADHPLLQIEHGERFAPQEMMDMPSHPSTTGQHGSRDAEDAMSGCHMSTDLTTSTGDLLLFRASAWGDDQDRPLQKADGSWTYFAGDVAYHWHKLQRGFSVLIDVWGADHASHVHRMYAAMRALMAQRCAEQTQGAAEEWNNASKHLASFAASAPRATQTDVEQSEGAVILSGPPSAASSAIETNAIQECASAHVMTSPQTQAQVEDFLDIRICQMVHFYQDGKAMKASKRLGNVVTIPQVLHQVPGEVVRFMMLTKTPETHLHLNIQEMQSQSKDNPVFYIQYAHARACSVLRLGARLWEDSTEPALLKEATEVPLLPGRDALSETEGGATQRGGQWASETFSPARAISTFAAHTAQEVSAGERGAPEWMAPNLQEPTPEVGSICTGALSVAFLQTADFSLLPAETLVTLGHFVHHWPLQVHLSALQKEPHTLTTFLYSMAQSFHSLWNQGNAQASLRFVHPQNKPLTLAYMGLIAACAIVLRNGLALLGIKAKEEMRHEEHGTPHV